MQNLSIFIEIAHFRAGEEFAWNVDSGAGGRAFQSVLISLLQLEPRMPRSLRSKGREPHCLHNRSVYKPLDLETKSPHNPNLGCPVLGIFKSLP